MAGIPPHAGQPLLTRGRPLGQGSAVMIMIHGRNAGPRNILDLRFNEYRTLLFNLITPDVVE